ncbi:metallophosphoesterase family protein [Lactobacillus agrestimuris]|uniref:metallophosphoesterase family protein n=1 Tax=Lactobacillus agrestimuris TaxID=2941328 RepID=UPI002043C295|nr:metallophosphoesterase [Lactobacillus agrestimuris]
MVYLTNTKNNKVYLLSDTHLIAKDLHDDGAAFQRMRDTSAGKDLDYQGLALIAFVRKVLKEKPAAVIITGDLTFNGERLSAEKLAWIFAPLKEAGIAFLVIPGNHDIYDGWARKFYAEKSYYDEQISPVQWKKIFASSYQNAISIDGLSYSINFNKNYRFIFVDSNIYGEHESTTHPITNGRLSKEQLKWIEKEFNQAKINHQHILFFMHHNLYDHNNVVKGGFTLDNAAELRKLCQKYQVAAVFSGHIHAQNIVRGNSECSTPEVASSGFSMSDQGYGIIDLQANSLEYQHHSFDMSPYLTDKEKSLLPKQDFHEYLHDIFNRTNQKQMSWLKQKIKDPKEYKEIIDFIDKLNWNFFIGKSNYSSEEKKEIKSSAAYQLVEKKLPGMRSYLNSLLDVNQDSQHLKIRVIHQ